MNNKINRSFLVGGSFLIFIAFFTMFSGSEYPTRYIWFERYMIIVGVVYLFCASSPVFSNKYVKISLGLHLIYVISLPLLFYGFGLPILLKYISPTFLAIGVIKGFFDLSRQREIVS